jgi:hypothetical protein
MLLLKEMRHLNEFKVFLTDSIHLNFDANSIFEFQS